MTILKLTEAERRAAASRAVTELIGPRIRALATGDLSLRKLGAALGYSSKSTLFAMIKSGDPPLSLLLGLAAVLGLNSIEELFGPMASSQAISELRR